MVLKPLPLPVLLIRGLTREQRHWGRFNSCLAVLLVNPVQALDFAGCGNLYQMRSAANITDLMHTVRSQQPTATLPVHLVAMSLGGMLALQWALNYPHEVASVTLINSSAKPLSPFYHRLRWQNYAALLSLPFLPMPLREQRILQLTTAKACHEPELVKLWVSWQRQQRVSRANALRQLVAASRFSLKNKPSCPVFVVSSAQDRLVDQRCSHALAEFLAAEQAIHPWAGHDIALDAPDWLAAKVAGFIQSQPH